MVGIRVSICQLDRLGQSDIPIKGLVTRLVAQLALRIRAFTRLIQSAKVK
jgi:hypothetical protein